MGTVAQSILEKSLRHKLGLARWENGVVRRIIELLNHADADIERRISIAVERNLHEDTITRLRNIRAELQSANLEAYRVVRQELTDQLQEVSKQQGRWWAQTLKNEVPFRWSPSRPSAHLLNAIVTSQPFQGALLKDHVGKLAGNRLDALVREVEIGLAQSESLSQLLQRVRGTRRGKFLDGVLHSVGRRQAEAVVRTAAQHVTESAREALFLENGDIIKATMWVNTLDHITCRLCQPRGGLVWRRRGSGYVPVGHGLPWSGGPGKIHWQCRCTGIPVFGDLDELAVAGVDIDRLGTGERAALRKPVPVSQEYEEWLRNQDFEIQASALNSEKRARAFRDGATLDEAWAHRFVPGLARPATLEEIFPP